MTGSKGNTFAGFVSVVSSAVNTSVWDVVYPVGDLPLLLVHTEDRLKWWGGAKAGIDRVFAIDGRGDDGIPLVLSANGKWFSAEYHGWRARLLVVENPVSFGFALVWATMEPEARKRLAEVMNERVQAACGVAFRVTQSGAVYEIRGKKKEPVDFQTPWALWRFLEAVLGEPRTWCSFSFPLLLRSWSPAGQERVDERWI